MLRTCLAAAEVDGTVSVFLEPIALYHERDLHEAGDDGWLARYGRPPSWAAGHVPDRPGPAARRRHRPDHRRRSATGCG